MKFPLPFVPSTSYKGGNGFGASRERVRPGLKHGANDLAADAGTPILAMDDGVVLEVPRGEFFLGTYDLVVQHSQFIARYCKISRDVEVQKGTPVVAGQVIAYVGDQPGADMLHLELYSGTAQGELTQKGKPYDRREDLIDPTPYLDRLIHTAEHDEGDKFRYYRDANGRIFIERADLRDI